MSASERLRLARVARLAALATDGVRATDSGPLGLSATIAGTDRVDGVTCTSSADGPGYDLELRVVCELIPLPDLAVRIRRAVMAAAGAEGLPVERVAVHFADLADPDVVAA